MTLSIIQCHTAVIWHLIVETYIQILKWTWNHSGIVSLWYGHPMCPTLATPVIMFCIHPWRSEWHIPSHVNQISDLPDALSLSRQNQPCEWNSTNEHPRHTHYKRTWARFHRSVCFGVSTIKGLINHNQPGDHAQSFGSELNLNYLNHKSCQIMSISFKTAANLIKMKMNGNEIMYCFFFMQLNLETFSINQYVFAYTDRRKSSRWHLGSTSALQQWQK